MNATLTIIELCALSALAAGVAGFAVLRLGQRGRSVRAKLLTVAVTTVLAVAAGVLTTAKAMFLSPHDFVVMLGTCSAAGVVALVLAVLLAHSVGADSRTLTEAMRALGGDDLDDLGAVRSEVFTAPTSHRPRRPGGLATAELDALHRELATTAARLTESRERERALERSRRELVAWVSHDLRTPLAGLRAMAEALEDGVAPEPELYHTRIRQTVDRLSGMVDDLFELSRIHAGALRLTLAQIALADLVDEAMVGADPLAKARGVRLAADIPAPLAVHCDARELSRALTNLVANAIRYTPSDGTVRVEAAAQGGHVVLAVTDACGGIPADDIDRVFDVAWRGTAARTPEPQVGAGLGLAIVRGIVEAHEGVVDVRNVAGGCRFEVRLPILAAA